MFLREWILLSWHGTTRQLLTQYSTITGSTASIKQPASIALLVVAFALVPVFIFWVGRQEKLGRPAIIPVSSNPLHQH